MKQKQEAQLSLMDRATHHVSYVAQMFKKLHMKRLATIEGPSRSFKVINIGATQ